MALALALVVPVLIWYGWYRLVGYDRSTLTLAQVAQLAAAAGLAEALRLGWWRLGLTWRDLGHAVVVGALGYAAVALGAWLVNLVGDGNLRFARASYDLWAFIDNWGLTAFGEELLFAGVLFTLVAGRLGAGRRWLAVPLVALLFALAHLPGYLAIGHEVGALLGRLGLNLASWLVFGTMYAVSGNLWLVVVAHAATDYGLTPLVTQVPLLGLLFMTVLVVGAFWSPRRRARRAGGASD